MLGNEPLLMNNAALLFPSVSKDEVIARQYLDRQPRVNFQLNGQQGQLRLFPVLAGERLPNKPMCFASQYGKLRIYNAEPLLNLLSLCPLLAENNSSPAQWYWDVYNAALSQEIKNIVGYLQPAEESHEPEICCWMEIKHSEQHEKGLMALSPGTLLRLLQHSAWHFSPTPQNKKFLLSFPLILASTELAAAALRQLRVGDIVLPENRLFNPAGSGQLQIGTRCFALQQCASLAPSFTIVSHKELEMEFTPVDTASSYPDAPLPPLPISGEIPAQPHEMPDLSSVPLRVTLRAGTLTLTLDALQSLQAGSILTFTDFTPGQAAIYYGERPLAQGTLVDVEGVLGLQITRMEHF